MTAPSKEELQSLNTWVTAHKADLPPGVVATLIQLLSVVAALLQGQSKAKETLKRLREAMGILPRSERGKTDKNQADAQGSFDLGNLSAEEQEKYQEMQRKRNRALREAAQYQRKLKSLAAKVPEQLEFELADPFEMVFSWPTSERKTMNEKAKVERQREFERETGLHSTFDKTKRVDLQILVTDISYEVETVSDPVTGKSVRASMDEVGPEGSQLTWRAIANLVKLVVGFAIPMNRVALLIGQPEFSSGKICRTLRWVATLLLPIYLYLFEDLADCGMLSGDDTKSKVLEIDEVEEDTLAHQIDEHLGWNWPKANGTGDKKALNVSLLIGRTSKLDPRSTIRFFRTHQGSVGNLLTRLLEWRTPKAGPLIFQGDLSTTNLPAEDLRKKFQLTLAGCGAHARRPFWRHRDEDGLFCYFMLRGFLALSRIESLIDAKGRTQANVLKFRNRYSRKIWQALYNRCVAATTGSSPGRFTFKNDGIGPDIWPPNTELHRAAKYVINHYKELTLYLDNPFLKYTNNGSERALRIEKCFLSSSKFTKTRNGRAVMDILRTINATCTAAGIDLTVYIRHIFKHRSQLQSHPEKFTPYAVALHLENEKQQQSRQYPASV
jgi:hypothetical protein